MHRYFDELDLWLTPFEVSRRGFESLYHRLTTITRLQDHGEIITGKYKVNFAPGNWYFRTSVTFQAHTLPNGKKIEPPSPQLIALHAACAKIAHMSGAAEHLEETFRDTEPLPVMTAPNAANELVHALKKVQLQYTTGHCISERRVSTIYDIAFAVLMSDQRSVGVEDTSYSSFPMSARV